MIEWKDENVNDHSSGITDLVTSSGSDFQEICRNLTYNHKLMHLSSRDGFGRYTEQETPTKIQQLFKLEDWIIAYCYATPADEDDQVSGQLYYRLESDTVSAWTLVETPKERTTAVLFRIYDSTGKGFTLRKVAPDTFDQWVVKDGTDAGTDPDVSYSGRTITLTVDSAQLNADNKYNTGAGFLKYSYFTAGGRFAAGWTCTLFSGTSPTDDVIFDELLTVQMEASPVLGIYPANARSEGDGTALPFLDEQGHIQPSDWQSHLYMALEPYIKTFTPNASDPFGKDPDTYPPDNNRLPLRKVAPIATDPGISPLAYKLKAINAQLPKAFIGSDLTQSELNDYTTAVKDFRYQVYQLRWNYASGAYSGDTTASIEIWCERTWGNVGAAGVMPNDVYLQYETYAVINPIDEDMPFSLGDWEVKGEVPYSSIAAVLWGKLYLVFHSLDAASTSYTTLTYTETVAAVQAAFQEYQQRAADIGGTIFYSAFRNFGFYIKVNPKAAAGEQLDLTNCDINSFYADNLPEDVAGNNQYGYAFYLRDSYEAQFEGSPREFVFDGPAAFMSVRTLSAIGLEPLKAYTTDAKTTEVEFSTSPLVYGGIAARMIRNTDLYFQSNMEGIFARTLAGGDVYYIDQAAKFWYRTADLTPPTIPQALVDDNWMNTTAYVVPHQSSTTDEDEQFNEQAYFNGGVLSYDSLPQGPYYFTIANQIGYYGNIVNNIQRVYDSVPGVVAASPATLFDDFDDGLSGLSHYLDKPIVTTPSKLWRIEGVRAADGTGRTFLRLISDEYGCIANQSIIITNVGLFLWSATGIVFTDGLKAIRVSEHLITRYQTWLETVRGTEGTIGPKQLRGTYDEVNRLVFWSLYDEDGKPFFVVLSLQKGISDKMPIHEQSGQRLDAVNTTTGVVTPKDYFLTHALLYSDDTTRLYRGQETNLMVQVPGKTFDESDVDNLDHPIDFYLKSVAYSYGLPQLTKQTSRILFTLRDMTKKGVSLTPLHWNDVASASSGEDELPKPGDDVPAHELTNCLSYQHIEYSLDYSALGPMHLQQFWRHNDCRWKSATTVAYKRRFGKGLQRQLYKQVGAKAMRLKFGEISPQTATVVSTRATYKGSFPQATVVLRIQSSAPLSLIALLDLSGTFFVSWEPKQKPLRICSISVVANVATIGVLLDQDDISNVADYVLESPTISFYRAFTDQRIDLLGYNLTYRVVGDRTQGIQKAVSKGGFDAG